MRLRCAIVMLLALGARSATADDDPYRAPAALRVASPEEVGQRLEAWLKQAKEVDAQAARTRYAAAADRESLDRLVEALAAGSPRAAPIAQAAASGAAPDEASTQWLQAQSGLLGDTLKLYVGRELARRDQFAAALPWLCAVPAEQSIDPAQALFYRAVCQQAQLQSDDCLDTLRQLLEVEPLPARYRVMARHMQAEMRGLQEESLDYVSRQMRDVERRLDRGVADRPLRKVQDDVLAALDKLIKQEEDKQNSSGGSGGGGGGGSSAQGSAQQSSQPAQDSRILGGRGPGRVAPKALGRSSGWGALPPKEREEAWQQLGREFPSHYREVVEQYFRELAKEEGSQP